MGISARPWRPASQRRLLTAILGSLLLSVAASHVSHAADLPAGTLSGTHTLSGGNLVHNLGDRTLSGTATLGNALVVEYFVVGGGGAGGSGSRNTETTWAGGGGGGAGGLLEGTMYLNSETYGVLVAGAAARCTSPLNRRVGRASRMRASSSPPPTTILTAGSEREVPHDA